MFARRDAFADDVRRVAFRSLPDHFPPDVTLTELGFDSFWHSLIIDVPGAARISEDEIDSWQTLGDIQQTTRHSSPVIIVYQHGVAARIDPVHIKRQTNQLPPRFSLHRLGTDEHVFASIASDLAAQNGRPPLCLAIPPVVWQRWQTMEDILASAESYRYWSPGG